MATGSVQAVLPTPLNSTSEPPPLFDGTTRLYTYYACPFAQRVWITRNYKGLQDQITLVPIDLHDRPAWYKEKVNPENKHNNKIMGESLDLIKYVDTHFDGPSLTPTDPAKREFGEELLSYTDTLNKIVYPSFKGDPETETAAAFDFLENVLYRFDDGPFFLGELSLVDIAYIPFIERFHLFIFEVFQYDFTESRPKLAKWLEEMNKIDAYKQTKRDPVEFMEVYKQRFLAQK